MKKKHIELDKELVIDEFARLLTKNVFCEELTYSEKVFFQMIFNFIKDELL